MLAVGRTPSTAPLQLKNAGVITTASGKIPTMDERTNVPHIYAVGDVVEVFLQTRLPYLIVMYNREFLN
jgi:pyruvate/2-oxoglutarate dehydrogenase complex dihydrolipoamide dehydrogenase (E3) component